MRFKLSMFVAFCCQSEMIFFRCAMNRGAPSAVQDVHTEAPAGAGIIYSSANIWRLRSGGNPAICGITALSRGPEQVVDPPSAEIFTVHIQEWAGLVLS